MYLGLKRLGLLDKFLAVVGRQRHYKCIDISRPGRHLESMAFEWDEEKREVNLVKHRLDFRD